MHDRQELVPCTVFTFWKSEKESILGAHGYLVNSSFPCYHFNNIIQKGLTDRPPAMYSFAFFIRLPRSPTQMPTKTLYVFLLISSLGGRGLAAPPIQPACRTQKQHPNLCPFTVQQLHPVGLSWTQLAWLDTACHKHTSHTDSQGDALLPLGAYPHHCTIQGQDFL